MNKKYLEIQKLIRENRSDSRIAEVLSNYHENDIAELLENLRRAERKRIYHVLGIAKTANVFPYFDDPQKYIEEISVEDAAAIISLMDSDDAVDILEQLDPERKNRIVDKLHGRIAQDVKKLMSYDEREIGSYMTTNYVCIQEGLSIRQAMRELVRQAGVHDNIMTMYVVDAGGCFAGAIDLKKLIVARENDDINDIILRSYPHVEAHEKIEDCASRIVDYAEDSIPVLDAGGKMLGVITSEDLVEIVDNELGEDYAKLAGLTAEEDLRETTGRSMKKRLPWLVVLLGLGMLVSSVVGVFEGVVAALPVSGSGYGGKRGYPVPCCNYPSAYG